MQTYSDLFQFAVQQLGTDDPSAKQDIQQLLCFTSGKTTVEILRDFRHECPKDIQDMFISVFERFKLGEPMGYLLESVYFRGHRYKVKKGVLIPREDTETLMNHVIDFICQKQWDKGSMTLMELGVGSGIISIELANQFPKADVYGWDINEDAIQLSMENKQEFGARNLKLIHGDFFCDSEQLDLILKEDTTKLFVSNPPYITDLEYQELDPSVKNYEPSSALCGGVDGLDVISNVIRKFSQYKIPLFFEIGHKQVADIQRLIEEDEGWEVSFYQDEQGRDRVLRMIPSL